MPFGYPSLLAVALDVLSHDCQMIVFLLCPQLSAPSAPPASDTLTPYHHDVIPCKLADTGADDASLNATPSAPSYHPTTVASYDPYALPGVATTITPPVVATRARVPSGYDPYAVPGVTTTITPAAPAPSPLPAFIAGYDPYAVPGVVSTITPAVTVAAPVSRVTGYDPYAVAGVVSTIVTTPADAGTDAVVWGDNIEPTAPPCAESGPTRPPPPPSHWLDAAPTTVPPLPEWQYAAESALAPPPPPDWLSTTPPADTGASVKSQQSHQLCVEDVKLQPSHALLLFYSPLDARCAVLHRIVRLDVPWLWLWLWHFKHCLSLSCAVKPGGRDFKAATHHLISRQP